MRHHDRLAVGRTLPAGARRAKPKDAATHVEALTELSRDAGSIPAASIVRTVCASRCQRMTRNVRSPAPAGLWRF